MRTHVSTLSFSPFVSWPAPQVLCGEIQSPLSNPYNTTSPQFDHRLAPITSVHQHLLLRADQSLGIQTDTNHSLRYSYRTVPSLCPNSGAIPVAMCSRTHIRRGRVLLTAAGDGEHGSAGTRRRVRLDAQDARPRVTQRARCKKKQGRLAAS